MFAKKRGLTRKAGPPVHDDLVKWDFSTAGPTRIWRTGISEYRTGEGKLYLCAIKDVHSNRIVGYSSDSRMHSSLTVGALRNTVSLRPPQKGGGTFGERGSQFRSNVFVRSLKINGLPGWAGPVARCADAAAIESFFALLQKNVLDSQ